MQSYQDQSNNRPKIATPDKISWPELIAEWEKSNESQKQFCDHLGLNINTFTYKRGKLVSSNKK